MFKGLLDAGCSTDGHHSELLREFQHGEVGDSSLVGLLRRFDPKE